LPNAKSKPTFEGYQRLFSLGRKTACSNWSPDNSVEKMLNEIFNILNELDLPHDQFVSKGFFFNIFFKLRQIDLLKYIEIIKDQ
jgi:hypothetical protein